MVWNSQKFQEKSISMGTNFMLTSDIDTFSVRDIDEMMEELRYVGEGNFLYYHYQRPFNDLDFRMFFFLLVTSMFTIRVYLVGKTSLHAYLMSPTSKVHKDEIEQPQHVQKYCF